MMNASQATLTMALLFALRCLVPLMLIAGIGYAMNWLVDKWEAEAAIDQTGTAVSNRPSEACWSIIKCDPASREACPGFKNKMVPCWLARTRAEGALPDECLSCPLYEGTPVLA